MLVTKILKFVECEKKSDGNFIFEGRQRNYNYF